MTDPLQPIDELRQWSRNYPGDEPWNALVALTRSGIADARAFGGGYLDLSTLGKALVCYGAHGERAAARIKELDR